MGWVQLSSLVRPKRQGTACVIGPKGEARIHGPRASSVPRAKLGHSDHVRHRVFIFRKLFTWVGFNYHPWLGPKDTKLRASLVPKAKIGYTDRVRHRFNYPPSKCLKKLLWNPKAKLGYTDGVRRRFNYPPSKCIKKTIMKCQILVKKFLSVKKTTMKCKILVKKFLSV